MFNHVCRKHLMKMFADLLPIVKEANDAVVVSPRRLVCAIKLVWPTSSFDVATTSLNSVRSALAFSTSLPENSDESTRSGTSDDGAVVGTAELAVPSVITVCLGRWDHRPRIVRRRNPNILERRVQNSNRNMNHAVRRRRREGTCGKYTKAQVQISVRTNDPASLGRACSFDVWTKRTWTRGTAIPGWAYLTDRLLGPESLSKLESFQKKIARGACQKTGATALRHGGRQQNSLTDKTTTLPLETSTKTSQLQRQVRFYRSESVLFRKQKKKPGVHSATKPWHHWPTKKNSSLEDQVCIAQTTTRMDSVPKNILNSRTCNIRNTGVCRHQRQLLELHVRYCEILTTANS